MKKIPTAEEFAKYELTLQHINLNEKTSWKWSDVQILMITFAKMHVQAATKEHTKVLDVNADGDYVDHPTVERILNSYPLTNIK